MYTYAHACVSVCMQVRSCAQFLDVRSVRAGGRACIRCAGTYMCVYADIVVYIDRVVVDVKEESWLT